MDIIDEFKPKEIVLRILAEKRTEVECTVVRPAPQLPSMLPPISSSKYARNILLYHLAI